MIDPVRMWIERVHERSFIWVPALDCFVMACCINVTIVSWPANWRNRAFVSRKDHFDLLRLCCPNTYSSVFARGRYSWLPCLLEVVWLKTCKIMGISLPILYVFGGSGTVFRAIVLEQRKSSISTHETSKIGNIVPKMSHLHNARIHFVCPFMALPNGLPVFGSHIRTCDNNNISNCRG